MTVVERIEAAYKRLEKARKLVADGKVHRIEGAEGYWVVEGSAGAFYMVNGSCTCPDYRNRGEQIKYCKHKLAVELYRSQEGRVKDAQHNGSRADRTARQAHGRGAGGTSGGRRSGAARAGSQR